MWRQRDFSLKVKQMTFNHSDVGSIPVGLIKLMTIS